VGSGNWPHFVLIRRVEVEVEAGPLFPHVNVIALTLFSCLFNHSTIHLLLSSYRSPIPSLSTPPRDHIYCFDKQTFRYQSLIMSHASEYDYLFKVCLSPSIVQILLQWSNHEGESNTKIFGVALPETRDL
jgi:hypothetical protein